MWSILHPYFLRIKKSNIIDQSLRERQNLSSIIKFLITARLITKINLKSSLKKFNFDENFMEINVNNWKNIFFIL